MDACQQILVNFAEKLYASEDIDTLFRELELAANQLGFEHISYTYVPDLLRRLLTELSPVFKLSSNYRTEFIEHYNQCNFGQHDFTIKRIAQMASEPINWWEEASQRNLSVEEKNIIEVAREDYGLRHGVTIPVFSDGSSIAGVSVTSGEKDPLFALLYQERVKYMTLIARMFSDRVLQLPQTRAHFLEPFLNLLSATEKNVLMLLSRGDNLKAIASELKLDYKYLANTVISSLRRKFGDIPRDQLLYQAGLIGFDQLFQ